MAVDVLEKYDGEEGAEVEGEDSEGGRGYMRGYLNR